MSEARTANAEQITYWNEVSGPKWAELGDVIDAQIAPVGLAAMDAAEPGGGERVLDIGCGCGQTTVELARRVGPAGRVLGVDVSGPMLADASAALGISGSPIGASPLFFPSISAQETATGR